MSSAADAGNEDEGSHVRVLVADDDAISARFLADGLSGLGAYVETCSHGMQALASARTAPFALLLLDCHMPGAGAAAIAASLRADAGAVSHAALIVASSAAFAAGERAALAEAGCAAFLDKPCTLADLRHVLALAATGRPARRVLDDAAGYQASGNAATLRALRELLRAELAALDGELETLALDPPALAARLHRLRAGCGFCGAVALADAARVLESSLPRGAPAPGELERFRQAVAQTARVLCPRGSAA